MIVVSLTIMSFLVEHRMYEKNVLCNVCLKQTNSCIFYRCGCSYVQIRICWLCSHHRIKSCMCSEKEEEEIKFYRYF